MEYVIRLKDDTFVRVYGNGKTWVTRVWANTATKFTSPEQAIEFVREHQTGGSIYRTFDGGKTVAMYCSRPSMFR